MATNETFTNTTESKTEDSVDSAKNQTKVTFEKNLVSQENRTRIAFLEMQQAELETEIRLLKQNGKNNLLFLTCSCGFINSNFQLFVKYDEHFKWGGGGAESIDLWDITF